MSEPSNAPSGGRRDPGAPSNGGGEQTLVTAAADGIVAVDHNGIIRSCNPAAEALFARPATELVGSSFGFPMVNQETSEIDLLAPGRSPRVVEMRVTTAGWQGEQVHVASLRDVTRRKRVEQELETALERQSAIVAVAAHELRAPVAEIKLLVRSLQDHLSGHGDKRGRDLVEQVLERVDGLWGLMRKLLTASRIDAENARALREPVPVLELILERLAVFGDKARDVTFSCSPDLVAMVDRQEFSEMLTNYLENAFSYGRPPVEINATERSGGVELQVCDHGSGVPEEFAPRMFDRFSRDPNTGRDVEGTGLGLWIVRNLAEANGGSAWYERAESGGACFCLRLEPQQGTGST
ncbi:PAS domain-containing sensor histidine kinase [Saccharopolyspora rhizosphaerae]|uniref:Sensor-like histidine kinase SenX3 n=1 Tax=Saccharopolyspora rhizosphaerae TaxID=2492662 RepID=A0A3R8PB42_9PSEU|nr:PAS domain-containing sensor histidine kinase [Saccharopolyspora rhizosphaerae]RRO20712.1 PAS domain-containing sensor histidine kinase [Saccharopolyspora rhizosphaerae]